MAYQVLTRHREIQSVQKQIGAAFRARGTQSLANIGYPGGHEDRKVVWVKDLRIWIAQAVIHGSRYMNALGTEPPRPGSLSIVCEINFPISGIDRRINGVVLADERGRTLLAHRGRINVGRKGIGAQLFWSHYEGRRLTVWDGDRESDVAAVAEIGSPRFLQQIQLFVHEVERIKALARDEQPDEDSRAASSDHGPARFEIQSLGDEFAGTRSYSINRWVDAVCDHGLIVRKLRELLQKQGYSTGKDMFRDLYVHQGGRVSSLFEVKPSLDRQSVYSAVGQLFFHSAGMDPKPQLVLVGPAGSGRSLQSPLQEIGIQLLEFQWKGDRPVFPDLTRRRF